MNQAGGLPWITANLDDAAVVGGKAASLPLLARHGLAVPRAFAVTHRLFECLASARDGGVAPPQDALAQHPIPDAFMLELDRALTNSGATRFAVRSSFALEDDPQALAAGVFESCVDVATADVPGAIRMVLRSAVSEAAVAYARARKKPWPASPVAVVVHPFVVGAAAGHVAADGDGTTTLWIREGDVSASRRMVIEASARAVALAHGAHELEWVDTDAGVVFVQARPYEPPPAAHAWAPEDNAPDAAGDDARDVLAKGSGWRWDESHNPLPLSPAQQGLVALVARLPTGFEQKVVGGYLFYRATHTAYQPEVAPALASAALANLSAEVQSDLAALGLEPSLAQTLRVFCKHYAALLGGIGHAVRAGRRQLHDFIATHAPSCAHELPHLLRAVPSAASRRMAYAHALRHQPDEASLASAWARYVAEFGDEAQAWDLAAPTVREWPRPTRSHATSAAVGDEAESHKRFADACARVRLALDDRQRANFDGAVATARACAAVGEDDDALYARLQAPVRHALLRLGQRLHDGSRLDAATDVFFLPLPLCCALDEGAAAADAADLRSFVRQARVTAERQQLNPPPSDTAPWRPGLLRGHGTGGVARGRVQHHDAHQVPSADAVLVARTLLPTELPLLNVAAIVTERGGPLDHVAAQARERALPAVVGVAGALARLAPGTLVHVDANAGVVRVLPDLQP